MDLFFTLLDCEIHRGPLLWPLLWPLLCADLWSLTGIRYDSKFFISSILFHYFIWCNLTYPLCLLSFSKAKPTWFFCFNDLICEYRTSPWGCKSWLVLLTWWPSFLHKLWITESAPRKFHFPQLFQNSPSSFIQYPFHLRQDDSTIKIKTFKENVKRRKWAHIGEAGLLSGLGVVKKQTWQEVNNCIFYFYYSQK